MRRICPDKIDLLLPQTQCGLCGYGGCMPYAEAIAYEHASIHLCPPGGVALLQQLGELLNEDPVPFIAEMIAKEQPKQLATIREDECIGCTKCIQACPVDAILGSAKRMHTVITDECTGCKLCVAPCPVDCIDMIANPSLEDKTALYRRRFQEKNQRVKQDKAKKQNLLWVNSKQENKDYIQAALARVQAKKKI